MKLFVVTGSSRGMGAAMVAQLLADPSHRVLGLARRPNESPATQAGGATGRLEQWSVDLADPVPVARRLGDWLKERDAASITSACLVNNAGVLTAIGALENCPPEELAAAIRVGLEAPLVLTAAFLAATSGWSADRRVLNISSGLGRRAMAGQATYCAAKAGMDHLSRAVALDQALLSNGARIVSLAPGVIDTDMQVQLRSAEGPGFPEQSMFAGLKSGGKLASPDDAAARVLAYLQRDDFGGNAVADVRDP